MLVYVTNNLFDIFSQLCVNILTWKKEYLTGTGKVDPTRKLKCTTAARVRVGVVFIK